MTPARVLCFLATAACGAGQVSTPAAPVAATRTSSVTVTKDDAKVPMRSAYAILQPHGNLTVWFSSEPRSCSDGMDFAPRPGEVTFTYDLSQHAQFDGSIRWAQSGYGFPNADGTSTGVSSLGDDLPTATVENRPGGHVAFALQEVDGTPLKLSEALSAIGTVDTTVCPTPAPPDPATGPGFVEISGHRFPTGIAILDITPDKPEYLRRSASLEIAILDWKAADTCKSPLAQEAGLRFQVSTQGALQQVKLTGGRFRGEAGSLASFKIHPNITEVKDGDTVEITGETKLFEHAYLNQKTGEFERGEGNTFTVKVGGKLRVIDCSQK